MFILVRALTYGSLFVGLLLVFVPGRILAASGIGLPPAPRAVGIAGLVLGVLGAGLALWCVLTFVHAGRGTPAPFDPPRRLVTSGPYRYLRNPMYLGAALALAGAALLYRSAGLGAYAMLFLLTTHAFVVLYEEPTLTRLFGEDYMQYRDRVGRWLPRRLPRR